MKKYALSAFVLVSFAGYAVYTHINSKDSPANASITTSQPTLQTPFSISTSVPTPTTKTTASGNSLYKDGEYIGDVTDAFYGNIQVKTVIQSGKITDVQFLQYPRDRNTSIEINQQAMPILKQEAIAAQNTQVDVVSGATQTSRAFIESLASTLQKAAL